MIKKDAIFIGSGQAAKPLSIRLAKDGWNVALIEKSEASLGGTCVNVGCTPTKTLIASAQRMHQIENAGIHGISAEKVRLDFGVAQERKRKVVEDSREGLKKRLAEAKNLELVYGVASFKDSNTLVVKSDEKTATEYSADYIFIDAGSRPRIPKIKGLDQVKWYDSTGILELKNVPEKLVVIGGGYIGLELGQMYQRLGSQVVILERSEQIMSGEDEDIASSIQEILEKEGMIIHCNASVDGLSKDGEQINVTVSNNDKQTEIQCTHVLIATGREPNTDSLNLDAAGIQTDDKGFIKVNGKLQTNVEGIYALGDINGGPAFTHIAYNDNLIVYKNIVEKKSVTTDQRIVPYCMYTDPQLGRVGLTEQQAQKQGLDIVVATIPGSRITRGIETGTTQGLWKAVVERDSGKILGAAILCTEGGEIASVIQMAMEGDLTAHHMAQAIFSHPSYSESINTLFMELEK